MQGPIYGSRWPQLAKLWDAATVTNRNEVALVAKRLVAAKARYQGVEAKTGVPWWMIAAIHEREASQDWNAQLAQGDPLHKVSTNEPIMGPFDTWEEGAIAALKHDKLTSVTDWRLEKVLHYQEAYNGWGYFFKGVPSSYVWAGTKAQKPGKWIRDHVWDPGYWDKQLGCAAMLKAMMEIDPSINPIREDAGPAAGPELTHPLAAGGPSTPDATPGAGAGEMRGTGAGLLRRAREHIGEEYVNTQIPKDDPKWKGPWDCAEFVSWLVYQEAGILYGCVDDNAKPSEADAYTGAWQTDLERRGIRVSVDQAAATVGGIVLRYPPPGGMGHIALCDGKGGTVEAKGRKWGVVADTVHGRGWHTGILVPGIKYDSGAAPLLVTPPAALYARNAPNMDKAIIVQIQQALAAKAFSPGEIDGEFGPETEAAVVAFQLSEGLVVDGQVGPDTAGALGISLTGEKPPESAKPVEMPPVTEKPIEKPAEPEPRPVVPTIIPNLIPKIIPKIVAGVGTMNPLIALAVTVLPDILKAVVSDKAGTVAGDVTQAVAQVTQTQNPDEAAKKLNADPAAVAALQLKLAEIAAAQEEKRQQAQLAQLKEQNEAQLTLVKQQNETQLAQLKEQNEQEIKRREAQLAELRADMEDTKDARSSFAALALANNPMAWGAPVVSFIVTLGFFGILVLLMTGYNPPDNSQVQQIVNITVGALAAAFATVVSFWLGSSQGSRAKDVATLQLQADQASQTTAALENQAKQAEALKNTVQAHAKQAEVLQSTIQTAIAAKPATESKPSNFRRCVDIVLAQEGGFSDDPKDPDAAAQFGIALGVLKDWRQKPNLTADDLRKLERDEACEIYRTRYWNVLRCDDLPTGVDLVVFDFGVDAGTARSARMLQQVVGAAPDGSIGDATVAATKAMFPRDVVKDISNRRSDYYRDPANAPSLIRDGMNRTNAVEKAALEMISAVS
jgi:lysozyme family protein/peptidoglycan hydrolase-like protein with peptidoglycan-binding domain